MNSGIMDVIVESTATKIFLPNPNARDEQGGKMYRRFGLNEREIEIIAGATPKREYYLRTDEHQRLVDLALGPLALAFLGVSDKESGRTRLSAARRSLAMSGWIEWIRLKGVSVSVGGQRKELNEVC